MGPELGLPQYERKWLNLGQYKCKMKAFVGFCTVQIVRDAYD